MNTKIYYLLNWVVFSYLVAVVILILNDNIYFGYGLGDLVYLYIISFTASIYLALILFLNQKQYVKKRNLINMILFVLFLSVAFYFTYEFTFGRGSEYIWDGNMFHN